MGQEMSVAPQAVGDVAIFDTNRSITGQDGSTYASADEAAAGDDFGAALAARLFAADNRIDHVWVQSNVATVRRRDGWDDVALAATADVIGQFFVYYGPEGAGDEPAGDEPGAGEEE